MQFEIIKERPKISVRVTRDSVCAGDDADAPHEKLIEIPSFIDPMALYAHIGTSYLPGVNGYGHSWDLMLNGNLIGVYGSGSFKPKVKEVAYAESNHVHFKYHSAAY
ncbi:hypothetical protein [Candidatus Electrothrix sp.]|uniref:hypothetical protein n=2 Tax=Candidatus Electrothrix sp. TaxID=2170559 RepID=UPI004055D9ED